MKLTYVKAVLGLKLRMDHELEQMDVKIVFLHGDLNGEIYTNQPEGFEVEENEEMVC